jgi:uncharacterized protein (TIGR00251 family)
MYLKPHPQGLTIQVRIVPNSSGNAVTMEKEDRLVIRLTAPPVEGKANKSLLRFLAKRLRVAPSSITILRGHTSRDKVLLISGLDELSAKNRLEADS